MPIIYETTAEIGDDGNIVFNINEPPFEKGTRFRVKLIPEIPFDPETYKKEMKAFIKKCSENNPFKGMTKDQILDELRRQRLEMCGNEGDI